MLKRYLPAFTIPFAVAATFAAWGLLPGTAFADPSPRPRQVNLTIKKQGNGTIRSTACPANGCADSITVRVGIPVTLTATPGAGFLFERWKGCRSSETSAVCNVLIYSNKAVHAVFSRPVNLTIAKEGDGTINSPACPASGCAALINVKNGTSVILTATPDAGFIFTRWEGNCSTSQTPAHCRVTMNGNKAVRAVFSRLVNLTIAKEGFGMIRSMACPSFGCGASINVGVGTSVTLTATPVTGFIFKRWEGCSTSETEAHCRVTMNGDKEVRAVFSRQ